MDQCKICESHAINPHCYGRDPDIDLDLCDVCYWRKRAEACQWHDIETAPKDGTIIDLWVTPHGRMVNYQYNAYSNRWYKSDGLVSISDGSPTHWMPLPKPPKAEESK